MMGEAPHLPVLIRPILAALAPVGGVWVDGTFGAGGYARQFLEAGADQVIGIDRDPEAATHAADLTEAFPGKLRFVPARFSEMADHVEAADGVVLDLGVSSMQLDQGERGFSFAKPGPIDMRMSQSGMSAADLIAQSGEAELAEILWVYGEERASRRIARAILAARDRGELINAEALAQVISNQLPRPKPGQPHPATRSFQALRIAVNDEFGELAAGLEAASRILNPGGWLVVVSFHSLEDRMVKRFMAEMADKGGQANRFAPPVAEKQAVFEPPLRAISADAAELQANPRARSARARIARRSEAPMRKLNWAKLGMPRLARAGGM